MPMHIYQPIESDTEEFIEFWSQRYEYAEEHLYTDNIGLELTESRILDLYRWKNGTLLAERRYASVLRNYVQRRNELAQLNNNISANDFLAHFSEGGAIWRIFWLHCFQPNRFPIYDQHVHRAMAFIQNGDIEEIPQYDPRKIESYIDRYLPFYEQFANLNGRDVDKALWAFGKFINENIFPHPA